MDCAEKPLALRVNFALRNCISSLRSVRTWVLILGPLSARYKKTPLARGLLYLAEREGFEPSGVNEKASFLSVCYALVG